MAIPFQQTDGFKLYLEIPPIELRVGATPEAAGKVEKFNDAGRLMARLDAIGRRRLVILSLAEAGQAMPDAHVDGLNLYLHNNSGLRSFRRVAKSQVESKYGWAEFRERLNIPTLAVIVPV